MTESSQDIEQTGASGFSSSALSLEAVGRILVDAREKMGLSVDDVGTRLRLTPKQVEAMESGHLEALPGPAFVRGFLRNYAKLLQIDAEPLLEACRTHGTEAAPKHISLHSENIQIAGRERKGWSIYLAGVVIVVLALAAWFAYMDFVGEGSQSGTDTQNETLPQASPDAPSDQTIIQPLPLAPTPEALPVPAPEVPDPAAAPATTPEAATPSPASPVQNVASNTATTPAAATAAVVLTATQTSWVGVTDRDGKELLGRNVIAGTSQTVNGVPPLKLVIGNAAGIQVTFNGNAVDTAPHIRSNVARMTLE